MKGGMVCIEKLGLKNRCRKNIWREKNRSCVEIKIITFEKNFYCLMSFIKHKNGIIECKLRVYHPDYNYEEAQNKVEQPPDIFVRAIIDFKNGITIRESRLYPETESFIEGPNLNMLMLVPFDELKYFYINDAFADLNILEKFKKNN